MAVIDDKLLIDHIEFGNRIKMYEELGETSPFATMHASEASIYYVAAGISA